MKRIIILTALILASAGVVLAEQSYSQSNTLINRVVTVPAGDEFRGIFMIPISSQNATVGQEVKLALSQDYYYRGKKIAPVGSLINGNVIEVSPARHGSVNGKLTLRFSSIVTPAGQKIPISAVVKTEDQTGTLLGDQKFGSPNEYSVNFDDEERNSSHLAGLGKGLIMKNEVGSGGGLVKSIWDKGSEVEIPVNAKVELVLTQPITVSPLNDED
ncbi:hypothetical protein IJ579_05535 [bacterium]|nr:hypothetical protein [bacterium]